MVSVLNCKRFNSCLVIIGSLYPKTLNKFGEILKIWHDRGLFSLLGP